jgi:hypothetical protein
LLNIAKQKLTLGRKVNVHIINMQTCKNMQNTQVRMPFIILNCGYVTGGYKKYRTITKIGKRVFRVSCNIQGRKKIHTAKQERQERDSDSDSDSNIYYIRIKILGMPNLTICP